MDECKTYLKKKTIKKEEDFHFAGITLLCCIACFGKVFFTHPSGQRRVVSFQVRKSRMLAGHSSGD